MAWLQNLAGKAEDLLNKVDQNAARVLAEPTSLPMPNAQSMLTQDYHVINAPDAQMEANLTSTQAVPIPSSIEIDLEPMPTIPFNDNDVPKSQSQHKRTSSDTELITNANSNNNSINMFEKVKSMTDSFRSVSSSNSIAIEVLPDVTMKLENHIIHLEAQNAELNKQILQLHHVHSELQNDNVNVRAQMERANDAMLAAQNEMQEYRIRARRMLEEREQALPLAQSDNAEMQEMIAINHELKNELDNEFAKNQTLESRFGAASKELIALQQQYLNAQKDNHRAQEQLRTIIASEKKAREDVEEEHRNKMKELQWMGNEIRQARGNETHYKAEIERLEAQLKARPMASSRDAETQLHALTRTLMHKQNTLDTITSERNALKIQLEKLELQYGQLCNQRAVRPVKSAGNLLASQEYDDSRIPRLVQVSPLDAGVTQRVKHAYSTLDAFSIRTGVFLRRYPLARIFLICYMLLLHLWVLIILFTYVPGPR